MSPRGPRGARRARLVLALGLLVSTRTALAEDAGEPAAGEDHPERDRAPETAPPAMVAETLVSGVTAALDGEVKKATKALTQAALMAPDYPELQEILGLAALLGGDRARAIRLFAGHPSLAVYHAMALADGPGGIGRAREVLAQTARMESPEPEAGVLFLAALAFAGSGDDERAHELLERAIKKAPSALDEAFAPDPAEALVTRAIAVLERSGAPAAQTLVIGKKLVEKGRRHAALALAARLDEKDKVGARRLRASALDKSDPRRALEELEAVLRDGAPLAGREGAELDEVTLKKAELQIAVADIDGARRTVAGITRVREELRSRLERAKAKLALEKGGDVKAALESAELAASLDPKSPGALSLLSRALLANGHLDRAQAFANTLAESRPRDLDAYAILQAIAEARHDAAKARMFGLRSKAFKAEKQRVEVEVKRRESVLRAVRDAERGLGIAGLGAVRGEEPTLSLPVELATAKSATAGFRRQAREHILAACKGDLQAFLDRLTGWDHVRLIASPYGAAEHVEAPLTAADPGRCSAAPQRTRTPKRR